MECENRSIRGKKLHHKKRGKERKKKSKNTDIGTKITLINKGMVVPTPHR